MMFMSALVIIIDINIIIKKVNSYDNNYPKIMLWIIFFLLSECLSFL